MCIPLSGEGQARLSVCAADERAAVARCARRNGDRLEISTLCPCQAKGKHSWASARQMSVQQWHIVHDAMKAAGPAGLEHRQVEELAAQLDLEVTQACFSPFIG